MTARVEDPKAEDGRIGVQVISRVGQIFRALEDEPWGLTLSQLATRLNLPRSTVHRLASALVKEGLLMSATVAGRVRIGAEFMRIATSSRSELRDQVAPLMRRVHDAVGETVDCGVLEGNQVRLVDVIETIHQLRAVSNIGAVFPLYCTAKGKAILSLLDNETIFRLVPKTLEPSTQATLRTRAQLMKEIEQVRETGLAYDFQENAPGICTVAIGAQDPFGVIFTISVPVPAQRFDPLKPLIERSLREISAELRTDTSAS